MDEAGGGDGSANCQIERARGGLYTWIDYRYDVPPIELFASRSVAPKLYCVVTDRAFSDATSRHVPEALETRGNH